MLRSYGVPQAPSHRASLGLVLVTVALLLTAQRGTSCDGSNDSHLSELGWAGEKGLCIQSPTRCCPYFSGLFHHHSALFLGSC